MMTDKHIEQWAGYLIEEKPYPAALLEGINEHIWEVIIEMYKKGYQDCLDYKRGEFYR